MFLVIYDGNLQREVFEEIEKSPDDIKNLYLALKRWIEKIYLLNEDLPAKFASKVFMGENFWDYSMEVRVTPAVFQLLVDILELPLWISWADMELGAEITRLTLIFSSASKIEGIPGRVIVAQFSDDDRSMEILVEGKTYKISTLLGGVAILYAIKKRFMKQSIHIEELIKRINYEVEKTINEIRGRITETEKLKKEVEELTDFEEELRELGE